MRASALELTVVIASVNARRSITRCVESVRHACDGITSEVLVVDASDDGTSDLISAANHDVRIIHGARGALVPELWAEGVRQARGSVVALTTGHCVVDPTWARALLGGVAAGAAGVGGYFRLDGAASASSRAMFLLRYSAFLALPNEQRPGLSRAREIAGDNAAYSHAALSRHVGTFADGFWEVEFHQRLRAEHAQLALAPDATCTVYDSTPLGRLVAQRFAHGRHFGNWRARVLGHSRVRVALAGPLVPLALFSRVLRRLIRLRMLTARLVPATVPFFVLAGAWATGEVVGSLLGARAPRGEPVALSDRPSISGHT